MFFDSQRPERSLRLSRHPDAGVIVLSIWNGGFCQGTFQLPDEQVAMFAQALLSAPSASFPQAAEASVYETGERHPEAMPDDALPREAESGGGPPTFVTGQYDAVPTEDPRAYRMA